MGGGNIRPSVLSALSHADRSQREKRALRLERLCRMVENAFTVPGKLKEQLPPASAVIFYRMAHCYAQNDKAGCFISPLIFWNLDSPTGDHSENGPEGRP